MKCQFCEKPGQSSRDEVTLCEDHQKEIKEMRHKWYGIAHKHRGKV